MKTWNLVHSFTAPKMASPSLGVSSKLWMVPRLGFGYLYAFSMAISAIGLGITAEQSVAQVFYFERPISATIESGVVSTRSGIGLNVRSGPGLSFPVIGGADDGNQMQLIGSPVFADGYRWQRVATGGWAASDYVTGNVVNVSFGNGCLRTISACGGDSVPVQPDNSIPIVRPISVGGPYVAAVPGGTSTLVRVLQIAPNARLDRAREGSFVNAGSFATYDGAQALTSLLRTQGLDARVIYR